MLPSKRARSMVIAAQPSSTDILSEWCRIEKLLPEGEDTLFHSLEYFSSKTHADPPRWNHRSHDDFNAMKRFALTLWFLNQISPPFAFCRSLRPIDLFVVVFGFGGVCPNPC